MLALDKFIRRKVKYHLTSEKTPWWVEWICFRLQNSREIDEKLENVFSRWIFTKRENRWKEINRIRTTRRHIEWRFHRRIDVVHFRHDWRFFSFFPKIWRRKSLNPNFFSLRKDRSAWQTDCGFLSSNTFVTIFKDRAKLLSATASRSWANNQFLKRAKSPIEFPSSDVVTRRVESLMVIAIRDVDPSCWAT